VKTRYFLTVDWCNKDNRGIFCDRNGNCFSSEVQHTEEAMQEILGVFWLVLNPQSLPYAEEEIKQFKKWRLR